MPPEAANEINGTFAGNPPAQAFHVETIVDPFSLDEVIGMVRHPNHPFVVSSVNSTTTFEDQCRQIGLTYLDALQAALGPDRPALVHPDIREALGRDRAPGDRRFGWLPVTWPQVDTEDARRPIGSFWALRQQADGTAATPSLLVLVAGAVDTDHQLQAGSDMGLRIVMHVHADEVRIHGVTLAGVATRRALDAVPEPAPGEHDIFGLVGRVREAIGRALDCGQRVWIGNLEKACGTDAPHHLIATGFALRFPKSNETDPGNDPGIKPQARARTYDFRIELARLPDEALALVQIHRDNFIGAGATLACFVQDAASNDRQGLPEGAPQRRATGDDDTLAVFRDYIDAELAGSDTLAYVDAATVDCFETWASSDRSARRLGGRTVASRDGVVVATPNTDADPPVRSDQQAAHDAHLRSAELFTRMKAYGLDPTQYFRFARLPLVQRIRPAMRWAPDGELPSAEVRPFLTDPQAWTRDPRQRKASDTLQLLLNYGSADPWHRRKLPLAEAAAASTTPPAERMKAQYLSVASDPRWAWHEFGHVMNFASTGELEFPFAHSAGDALAAIACDPTSRLASAGDPDAAIRHVTYPWIQVPGRSHGRSALHGYGWCGCRNISRLNFTASLERYHHSYFGEQLMSSSLFRLYRSLGGDTRDADAALAHDDEAVRLSASDYCIYLIMRGISLLGPDTLAPSRTPDQFVSALIEADLGTGDWTLVDAAWPFNRDARKRVHRRGGRAHKVIRWAFEQQGLYATERPREVRDEVGAAPAVDVFIPDRRPASGEAGDGGYAPVPLRSGTQQPWHAHADALFRQQGRLHVRLGNRGSQGADLTTLRVWLRATEAEPWRSLRPLSTAVTIPAQARTMTVSLELPDDLPADGLWVLVSADTPADPSNLPDGATPPRAAGELLELVANDNNLALAWIG